MEDAGRRIRVVPVSTGTFGTLSTSVRGCRAIDARFSANRRVPLHTHETACVTIVLDGEFSERLLARDRVCVRGSVLAKPPLEPHEDTFGRNGSRQLIIEVAPGALADTSPSVHAWDVIVHTRAHEAEIIGRTIARELIHADPVSQLSIEGLMLELFALLWRLRSGRARRSPPPWLMRARDLLSDQFHSSFSVGAVAAEAGVHPTHLAREFRHHFGESVGHYVRRLRVEWSKTELLTSAESLARIAVRAGFNDQAHFTRWFKRETGLTPHRYRSARRSDDAAAD